MTPKVASNIVRVCFETFAPLTMEEPFGGIPETCVSGRHSIIMPVTCNQLRSSVGLIARICWVISH